TCARPSSEFATTFTANMSCDSPSSGHVALIQPAATSIGRSSPSPQPGVGSGKPGWLSLPGTTDGVPSAAAVLTVAAAYCATAIVALAPGSSENGPEPTNMRTSAGVCAR